MRLFPLLFIALAVVTGTASATLQQSPLYAMYVYGLDGSNTTKLMTVNDINYSAEKGYYLVNYTYRNVSATGSATSLEYLPTMLENAKLSIDAAKRCTTTLLYCGDGTNDCNTVTCTNDTFLINISSWDNLSISPGQNLYINSSHTTSEFRLPPEVKEEIIQEATRRATDKTSQALTNALIVGLLLLVIVGARELLKPREK